MSVAIYHALVTSGFNIYLLELLALYFALATSIILLGPGKFSADYLINEIFINKKNPIADDSKASDKRIKIKNVAAKAKPEKPFAFPFSSFLSS